MNKQEKRRVSPLDVVRTPKGAIALVTEINEYPAWSGHATSASIDFFPQQEKTWEKCAWWNVEELEVLGSIPYMLANAVAHNCGGNTEQGKKYFGR